MATAALSNVIEAVAVVHTGCAVLNLNRHERERALEMWRPALRSIFGRLIRCVLFEEKGFV